MDFIAAEDSQTGYPLLLVACEVSGTVAVMQINEGYVEKSKEITIFHTNDVHSRVDNYSKVKAYINNYDNKLLVDAGDTFIDGHSHSILEDYSEFNNNNETKIASTGEYLKGLGQVTVSFNENLEVENIDLKTVDTANLVEEDAEISNLITSIRDNQQDILNEVVGSTPIKLEGSRELVRSGHTNLGRLITSAMLNETGADIAITNGGGIRDSIEAGDITKDSVK